MSTPDDPDDPNTLSGYDLSAWQAPPPPAGLTDSVLARMQLPMPAPPRTRSMRTISAAAGATLVAAAAIAALVMTHHTELPASAKPPVATAQPALAPPLAAGGSPDRVAEARLQELEQRVAILELQIAERDIRAQQCSLCSAETPAEVERVRRLLLQAKQAQQQPPQPPQPPDQSLKNPFSDDDPTLPACDPFAHPHGCASPPPPVEPEVLDVVHGATGTLKVQSTPPTSILIDGNDMKSTTPASFELVAGRHKVTFRLGGNKYSYPVTIQAGITVELVKDLR